MYLRYAIAGKIPIVANSGSNYDLHLMIKHLVKKFVSRKLERLGIKCISFSVSIDKIFWKIEKIPMWKQKNKTLNANQTLF